MSHVDQYCSALINIHLRINNYDNETERPVKPNETVMLLGLYPLNRNRLCQTEPKLSDQGRSLSIELLMCLLSSARHMSQFRQD